MATWTFPLSNVWFSLFGCMAAVASLEMPCNPEEGLRCLTLGDRQEREVHWSNGCLPIISDNQTYYSMSVTKDAVDTHWVEIDDEKQLSPDDETYPKVTLPWNFPFYGHDIYHIFPSPLGFMSMSEVPEATQHSHYVAPFFGHFTNDTRYTSPAYFQTTGDKLIVEWKDMFIRDLSGDIDSNPCQFQVIIFKNGTMMFLYKKVPPDINRKQSFMVGIHGGVTLRLPGSDDVKAFVSYQGLSLSHKDIHEGTVVTFSPKSYCGLSNDSQLCESDDVSFYCKHCHFTQHCNFKTDKLVHEWLYTHCSNKVPERCNTAKPEDHGHSPTLILILVGIVAVVAWTSATGIWCYYAYTRPTTPSGRWLIEHRPSQWKSLCLNWTKSSKDDQVSTTGEMDDDEIPRDGDDSSGY